jgi:hypothetical protein
MANKEMPREENAKKKPAGGSVKKPTAEAVNNAVNRPIKKPVQQVENISGKSGHGDGGHDGKLQPEDQFPSGDQRRVRGRLMAAYEKKGGNDKGQFQCAQCSHHQIDDTPGDNKSGHLEPESSGQGINHFKHCTFSFFHSKKQ